MTRTTLIQGFTEDSDPEVRQMSNGSVHVMFGNFPPLFIDDPDHPHYRDFDRQMQRAIGATVRWEDRELFVIPRPPADLVERLRKFLIGYKHPAAEPWSEPRPRIEE